MSRDTIQKMRLYTVYSYAKIGVKLVKISFYNKMQAYLSKEKNSQRLKKCVRVKYHITFLDNNQFYCLAIYEGVLA